MPAMQTPHPDLAGDLEQWLGLFQWPVGQGPQRRIDLVFSHHAEFPYAVLAWTGSEMFEVQGRTPWHGCIGAIRPGESNTPPHRHCSGAFDSTQSLGARISTAAGCVA